jgi:peroxiredoxin
MESSGVYKMRAGDDAYDFSLPGIDGKTYSLASFTKPVMVLFFSCNHCPYVVAYEDRIIALAEEFKENVDVVAINSNDAKEYPDDSFENMKKHAEEKKFNFTYLHDETQETAKSYGGECTPHFFIFDKDKKVQYIGRFDDNKDESKVTKHELKEAVQSLLESKPVENPVTNAFGCSIKWKQ